MAHFAELNKNNEVLRVIVISNDITYDNNGNEDEQLGIDFCKTLYGLNTVWKQASYNGNFRNKLPEIGWIYLEEEDMFMPPKPADYFIIQEFKFTNKGEMVINRFWAPNLPYPDPSFETKYEWNFETLMWDLID
jgi:hypothetical protein